MRVKYVWLMLICLSLFACTAKETPAQSGSIEEKGDTAGVPVEVEGGVFTRLTPQQLAESLPNKDFVFVNTHIPYEGEIEQTDAFIPYDETVQRLDEYPADKNSKIVLYCRSGRMSTIAAEELVKAGYTNVWELDGGMAAWEGAGYELIQK